MKHTNFRSVLAGALAASTVLATMEGGVMTVLAESVVSDVTESVAETVYPLTITDAVGNEITIESKPETVVSVAPSNTEILFAIGAGDQVVGRTDYCDYPAEAADVASIGTYVEPNTELITSLEPDLVFESSTSINEDVNQQLEELGIQVIILGGQTIDDVEDDILMAGEIMDLAANAADVVNAMEEKREAVSAAVADEEQKSVFIDNGMFYSCAADTPIGGLLAEINVNNIAADAGSGYPQLTAEQIVEANPDVYISLYPTPDELKATDGIKDLDCIVNDQIVYFEGMSPETSMISRPGPRMADGMEVLAKAIYPDAFA